MSWNWFTRWQKDIAWDKKVSYWQYGLFTLVKVALFAIANILYTGIAALIIYGISFGYVMEDDELLVLYIILGLTVAAYFLGKNELGEKETAILLDRQKQRDEHKKDSG